MKLDRDGLHRLPASLLDSAMPMSSTDASQTEGAEFPAMREVYGDVGENYDRLVSFIKEQGIELVFTEKIAPALGMSYGDASPSCPVNRRPKSSRRWCMN